MSGYTEDLSSVVWRHPEFLAHFGGLTEKNVLDYFSESPFWDRQSTNQTLRMQTQYLPGSGEFLNESEDLLRFVGTEFALVHSNAPATFIIHKRRRSSPTEAVPIAAYYVMNANVYQAPDLYSILSTRLLSSIHSFQSSLDMVRDKAPLFDTRKGYVWEIEKSAQMTESSANASIKAAETTDKEPSKDTSSKPANSVKSNAEAMLWAALQTTAKDMR